MEKNFVKVQSTKDIIISLSLIVAGVAIALLPIGGAANVTGILVAITGAILLFTLKNGYKESLSGERYDKIEHYYPINMKNELVAAVSSHPESLVHGDGNHGNAMRLVIFFNKKSNKAFVQLYEYVPYKYELRTNIIEYNLAQVAQLLN